MVQKQTLLPVFRIDSAGKYNYRDVQLPFSLMSSLPFFNFTSYGYLMLEAWCILTFLRRPSFYKRHTHNTRQETRILRHSL